MTVCSIDPILEITDGTTTVDLLGNDGIFLLDWTPVIQDLKEGGSWKDSPLVDGRRMAMYRYMNAIETFDLKVRATSKNNSVMDGTIANVRKLRELLIKARDYWTVAWQDTPVYLKAKGPTETNARYAVIMDWKTPQDDNPFAQPFMSKQHVMDEFTLIIERGFWLDTIPGVGSCVKANTLDTFFASGADMVANGGFETWPGAVPTSWSMERMNTTGDIAKNTVNPYGGSNCAKIYQSLGSSSAVNLYQEINVTAETTIHISFWYRHDKNKPGYYWIKDVTNWPVWSSLVDLTSIPYSAVWTNVTLDLTIPAGCTKIRLAFYAGAMLAEATMNIDNVSITENQTTYYAGQDDTCDYENYINKWQSKTALTHILRFDESEPPGSEYTELLGAAQPFKLFPTVPAINDAIFFGTDTATLFHTPFWNVIFDIGTAQTGITDISWYYWSSDAGGGIPGWVEFAAGEVVDETDIAGVSFSLTGVGAVKFAVKSDMTSTTVNSISGYWIKAQIDVAPPGAVVVPTQQNRDIYTCSTTFLDIAATEISGDLSAYLRLYLGGETGMANFVRISARSVERGADFTPYIHVDDNISGISVSLDHAVLTADILSPVGYYALCTTTDTTDANGDEWGVMTVTFDYTVAKQFAGQFRLFAVVSDPSVSDIVLRYATKIDTATFIYGQYDTVHDDANKVVCDLGTINLPYASDAVGSDTVVSMSIEIRALNNHNTPSTFKLHYLVLMPVDEWACEIPLWNGSTVTYPYIGSGYYLDVDGFSRPKRDMRVVVREDTSNYVRAEGAYVSNGIPQLRRNKHQRLWFMHTYTDITTIYEKIGDPDLLRAQVFKQQRYLSMRGTT